MNMDGDKVEDAIYSLREAMRADVLVIDAAHFCLSSAAFCEISKKAEELTEEIIKKMKEIPVNGEIINGQKVHWNRSHYAPLAKGGVPCSLIHICIHEAATGSFSRPDPPKSEDDKDEYEIRAKFADWWEKHAEMCEWDKAP